MEVLLTDEFVSELKAISKTPSHTDCEQDLIAALFNKESSEIRTGCKRLGGDAEKSPFLRKRVESANSGKSSGYRIYLWLFEIHDNIYLLFIHPKSGRRSASNITHDKQRELVRTFKTLRDDNEFRPVQLNEAGDKIVCSKNGNNIF